MLVLQLIQDFLIICPSDFIVNMPLEWLFGRKKTPEEMLRQNQRALNKAMRDLDRERQKMEQQEKKVIADIKKMAKQGQMVWQDFIILINCLVSIVLLHKMYTFNNLSTCMYV